MRNSFRISLFSLSLLCNACGQGDDGPGSNAAAKAIIAKAPTCTDLAGLRIPASAFALATNGAQITSGEIVPASGSGASALGEYCKIKGTIAPIDSQAPPISFLLNLPTNWNRKIMMFGGGGYYGEFGAFLNVVHAGPLDQLTPQGRGYAVFTSDAGHRQQPPFIFGRDASFAMNDEALHNYTGAALKKTRDAAVFVVHAYYQQAIQKAYFSGGSSGGREALQVVQQWPQDYDGAIAMFPAWNSAAMTLQFGRLARALAQTGAYLNPAKRKLLYRAALAACDGLDGINDGVISNVSACNAQFDPATAKVDGNRGAALRCTDGAELGDGCLSDAQIGALKIFNTPARFQFTLASGETQYPGFNVWGADLGIRNETSDMSDRPDLALSPVLGLNSAAPHHPVSPDMPYGTVYFDQWTKYFVTRDASFNGLSLDPENPGPWASRISALSTLQDINRTDLSVFRQKGGKLLIAHGSADALVSTRASADYYQRLQDTMGTDNVAQFVRYYEVPGYGHSIGRAFNLAWDSLTALENWAERGVAPLDQIAYDKSGVPGRSRPLCAYPAWPKYVAGDPALARSFVCTTQ